MPSLRFSFNGELRQVPLRDRATIGRMEENDICVPVSSLSRRHAMVLRNGLRFVIVDQQSRNGIMHAGARVKTLELADGAVFSLGEVEFVFDGSDDSESAPVAADALPAESPEPPAPAEAESSRIQRRGDAPTPAAERIGSLPAGGGPLSAAALRQSKEAILEEMSKVIVGQKTVLEQILIALFARGHCLLIGVPGLAKTLLVKTLGSIIDLDAKRIQFTPDLMPSDISGADILEEDPATGARVFRFHRGPLFTNLLLADEINRTPPKTQAALLEAMQEYKLTNSGVSYPLPQPFMVLATQNPIEQEGTYPLPEAQLDRFMFCIHMTYPSAQEEQRILMETTGQAPPSSRKALTGPQILQFQDLIRQVPVSQHVASYALNLARATRPETEGAPEFVKRWIRWGAGTRAGQCLLLAAKARALLDGRSSASCADVRAHALPALRHRIFLNFTAASEGVGPDKIVSQIVDQIKEPAY